MPRQAIKMDEIPFAPIGPALCDTVPPAEPPSAPLPTKRPVSHRLVGWRHDGGMLNTTHETIELARDAAAALHWAIYWKYAIMCGRDMVALARIDEPTEA